MLGGKPQLIVDHAMAMRPFHLTDRLSPLIVSTPTGKREIWLVGSNGEELRKLKIRDPSRPPAQHSLWPGVVAEWATSFRHSDQRPRRSIESCDLQGKQIVLLFFDSNRVCVLHWATDGRMLNSLDRRNWRFRGLLSISGRPKSRRQRANP